MQILYDRIRKDGIVRAGNVLKVDRFLNHQMDIHLFQEIGKEFKRRFEGEEINKILTIEASGIGIACVVAQQFHVPVVFAKKTQTKNIAGDVYTSKVESIGLMAALGWCVFPFILPDCVKIALAILIAKRLPKRFVYQGVATKKDAAV